jgi:hypothetical protein
VQSSLCRLVLVIVARASVDLADAFGFEATEYLGEHADLERPPLPYRQARGERGSDSAFAGERVTEALEKIQKGVVTGYVNEREQKRGEKKTADTAVQSIGDPAIIHLRKIESKCWFCHSETEPCEGAPLERQHVRILEHVDSGNAGSMEDA